MTTEDKKQQPAKAPQGRARDHMARLLKNAALGGAALTLGNGCGSCGPMVCDPLPPPICDNSPTTQTFLNDYRLQTSAKWTQADAGPLAVSVELSLYNEGGETLAFKSDPAVTGATLGAIQREARKLTFTFTPNAGATKVEAIVELDCASKPEALKLGFDVAAPSPGAAVAVSSLE